MKKRTQKVGKNGVPFTVIQVANTPLENIEAIGRRIKLKEIMDKMTKDKPLTKNQRRLRDMRLKKMHKDMKNYLNSKNK